MSDQPNIFQKLVRAGGEYVSGMVPQTAEQWAAAAGVPTDLSPESIAGALYPPLRLGLQMPRQIAGRAQQVRAAEQTPPFSQERFNAGIGTVLDIAGLAGIAGGGKALLSKGVEPPLRPGPPRTFESPLVAARAGEEVPVPEKFQPKGTTEGEQLDAIQTR